MKHITKTFGFAITGCALIAALYSCNNNKGAANGSCADSTTTTTTTTTTTDTTAGGSEAAKGNNGTGNTANGATENNKLANGGNAMKNNGMADEPTGPGTLNVTSAAFASNGVIPGKYTCDGQGVTPPLNVANIPPEAKSLTVIIHDYNANPDGGFTYWIIWNLDPSAPLIPENFTNDHEGMNAAKQYGYTPICAKSGNHKYHFIVYAVDSKLNMGKNATKKSIEDIMRGHVLAKGELVGVYNKHLD